MVMFYQSIDIDIDRVEDSLDGGIVLCERFEG